MRRLQPDISEKNPKQKKGLIICKHTDHRLLKKESRKETSMKMSYYKDYESYNLCDK